MSKPNALDPSVSVPENKIRNGDQLMAVIMDWWDNRLKRMEHVMAIPSGTAIVLEEEAHREVVLEGATLEGFLLGIRFGTEQFLTFPFAQSRPAEEPPRDASAPNTH
jgi:hypothetical protein